MNLYRFHNDALEKKTPLIWSSQRTSNERIKVLRTSYQIKSPLLDFD